MSLRDLILATPYTAELAPVPVPQWPGTEGKLFVRSLSALDHERYMRLASRYESDDSVSFFAEVTALVLVDEDGKRLFTNPDDVKALAGKDIEPLQVIVNAFTDHTRSMTAKKKVTAKSPAKTKPATPPSSR